MPSPAMFDLHDPGSRDVPGHDHWHPDLPGVAEVITGGSVRMECPGRGPGGGVLLCGPLVVVGAEPGDVIVVDVLGVGRAAARTTPAATRASSAARRPTPSRCPPAPGDATSAAAASRRRPPLARPAAGARARRQAVRGDLHFPARGGDGCDGAAAPGWIDLRVNLTRRGVERFRVTGPMLMPDPSPRVA